MSKSLTSSARYSIIRSADGDGRELVTRNNGTTTFKKSVNARKLAHRLSRREPGARFYVVSSVAGFQSTATVTKKTY